MKKNIIIFNLILTLALISGCVKNDTNEEINKNAINEEKTTIDYSFSVGIEGWQGEAFTYNGDFLEIPYFISNDANKLSGSILIFINGVPQMYSVEESELSYTHKIKIKEKEKKVVSLKIKPNIGNRNDSLNINFAFVLNPEVIKDLNKYKHNHSISQFIGATLNFNASSNFQNDIEVTNSNAIEQFSESELKELYVQNQNGVSENKLDSSFVFKIEQNGQSIRDYLATNTDTKIKVAGNTGKYVSYVVYDGDQITKKGIEIETSKDYFTIIDIGEIDTSKTNFYVLLIPKSTDGFIEQSEKYIIKK